MVATRRWPALVVVLSATFVQLLDVSIVGVAAADIQSSLRAPSSLVQLVLVGYQIGFAATLVTAARLGDVHGRRRLFLVGMVAFTAASIGCALAGSITVLVVARVVQGVASGLMFPQVLSLIQVLFAPQERGAALGAYGATIGLGTVLGPVAGGLLIEAGLSADPWRAIFLVNVPIGVAATVAGLVVLPESTAPDRPRLDPLGAVLSAAGLALVLYPLAQGREAGWPAWSWTMLAVGLAVLAVFVLHQRARTRADRSPVLDLRLFTGRAFSVGALLAVTFYAGVPGFFLVLSLFLQEGRGLGALATGLTILPFALGSALTAPFADGVAGRIGVRVLALGAGVLLAGMAALVAAVALGGPQASPWLLVPGMAVGGLGFGLFVPPLVDLVLGGVPPVRAGAASGALTSLQQVGAALGVALIGIVYFGAPVPEVALTRALVYEIAVFALVLALVAALPRLRPVPDPAAAAAGAVR